MYFCHIYNFYPPCLVVKMSTKNTKGWLAIDVCAHCKKPASTKCADCRISSYCSQRCQKFNRKQHRYFMQCSKDNKTEMTGENKIMFEEFLEAQALLSYAFFGTGHFLLFFN